MSIFNKVLASVGIGAAKVDTKLERETIAPGEEVRGVIEVTGGNINQAISGIHLTLYTTYIKESDDKKYTHTGQIDKFRLTESLIAEANERKEIPFSFRLPTDCPLTIGKTKVWVTTGLDIKNAVDPTDKDYVKIVPNRLMESVLNALEDLGFRLRQVECKQAPYLHRRRLPFIQELEFVPIKGDYMRSLDELEVVFCPISSTEVEVVMQVDRKARGLGGFLAEALDSDETNVRLKVTPADIPSMKQKIQNVIEQYS